MNQPRRWRVLLIDDSEITLELQQDILSRAGFDVRSATKLGDFGKLLHHWSPEIILTDVVMPDMSGVDLCRTLKSRYDTAHVPIVLCSTLEIEELERLARECDADGFVSKSDGLDTLPDELRLLCEELSW
jgi:twitching motility two-component system response regulator PilH